LLIQEEVITVEEEVRLQKIIADRGYCSRRKAEELIVSGAVKVNGVIVNKLGAKFSSAVKITIYDEEIDTPKDIKYYLALNKPLGVISTMQDDRGRRTIAELIPPKYGRLFPIGRLDVNSSGLIILTNDGEFANLIMHPSSEIEKTYEVIIKGIISNKDLDALRKGIMLEDGLTAPAKISLVESVGIDKTKIRITIHEGKNREIRRMMQALNHEVLSLNRISIDILELGDLERGKLRAIPEKIINKMKETALKKREKKRL